MIYRFAHIDMFDELEKIDFKRYSGNVVLWGAGKIGSVVAHRLAQLDIKFLAFVDTNTKKHGTEFSEHKVISVEELFSYYPEAVVIITTVHRREVIEQLNAAGRVFFDAWPLLLEFDWNGYHYMNELYMERMVNYYFLVLSRDLKLKKKYFVDILILNITNRCNLRCEECSVFIPSIERPCDFDKDEIISDAMNVIDAIGCFRELSLFGGEPFLHKHLAEIILAFKDVDKFESAHIITNGAILPDDKLISAIKSDNRMFIRISDYGKLSSNKDSLIKLLHENNIKCEILDYKNWYKRAEIRKFVETEEELRKKFNCCMGASFPCVSNGKLFLCKVCMSLCEMDVFPEAESNFLDLTSLRNMEVNKRNEIIRKYIERMDTDDYIDACKYCSGKSNLHYEKPIPPAKQIKGVMKIEKIKN